MNFAAVTTDVRAENVIWREKEFIEGAERRKRHMEGQNKRHGEGIGMTKGWNYGETGTRRMERGNIDVARNM